MTKLDCETKCRTVNVKKCSPARQNGESDQIAQAWRDRRGHIVRIDLEPFRNEYDEHDDAA